METNVTVLLYHDVLSPGEENADVGCIRLETLHEHVEALGRAGFDFVPLDEALAAAQRPSADRGAMVAFTFDDGYAGLYPCLPALAARLRPTLFVLSDYLGRTNLSWNTRSPVIRPHLTLSQVRELAAAGVCVEAHGTDHHNLLKFTTEQLRERFGRAVAWFEEQLGYRPRHFAYPYGACDARVESVAADFFDGAVTVNHGVWSGPRSRHGLNRLSVPSYLSGGDLVEVIGVAPSRRWVEVERRAPWRG